MTSQVTQPLLFVDTNVFLDLYRSEQSASAADILEHLGAVQDQLIWTEQVAMEWAKNRQESVRSVLNALQQPGWERLQIPGVFARSEAHQSIRKAKAAVAQNVKSLQRQLEKVLTDPSNYDDVYVWLMQLFAKPSRWNLRRGQREYSQVYRRAWRRFAAGMPPRKRNDLSIGDALNWEWILQCATTADADVIVVTRDEDYGMTYGNMALPNDWLALEFAERVGNGRRFHLTRKVSDALAAVHVPVTAETKAREDRLLSRRYEPNSAPNDVDRLLGALREVLARGGNPSSDQISETLQRMLGSGSARL